ncbi:MAG: 3-isopropylmalate dehydratase small subunit [Novosphingobium sp.]
MNRFEKIERVAAPLPRANVDTDAILPSRFLKTIHREGLGEGLFADLRAEPDFMLNRAPWDEAGILVALGNFGCGSSREHAPWALLDFGIRCVIAPSFADIFYNNCFKNGILPLVLSDEAVDELMTLASSPQTCRFIVDLPAQEVRAAGRCWSFDIDPKRKIDLLEGRDEIGRSLGFVDAIVEFERRRASRETWLLPITFP